MNTCDPAQVWTTSHCQDQATPRLVVAEPHLRRRELRPARRSTAGAAARSSRAAGGCGSSTPRSSATAAIATGPDVGGGAVRALSQYHGLPVYVVGSRFTGNVCSNGGALSSIGVSWTVAHSRFIGNRAIGRGANPARPGTPGRRQRRRDLQRRQPLHAPIAGTTMTDNHAARGRRGDLLRQQRPHRHARDQGQRPAAQPQRRLSDRRPARHLLPRRRSARDRPLRPALSAPRPAAVTACGHGFQLVERIADELGQAPLVGRVVPALEGDPEHRDPGLGRQARGRIADAALAQRVGERRGE